MTKTAQLTDRSLIALSGSDGVSFLQNLITADVENLNEGELRFGALLTPQGKVLFDFFITKSSDGFILDTATEQAADLIKRLTFYKLRADVTIQAVDNTVFAVWGGEVDGGIHDPRHPALGQRLYGETTTNADIADWDAHRVGLGVPQSLSDFDLGDVFPHDVLMDQSGGVDFQKGCYVGQEVVSRMQHRGTARTRTVKIMGDGGTRLPEKGTEITASGKTVGRMGSAHKDQGIAFVRIDRVGKALAEGAAIAAGDVVVTLSKPDHVSFDWPV